MTNGEASRSWSKSSRHSHIEFLVGPTPSVVAAPNFTENETAGDRPSRDNYSPKVPYFRPGGLHFETKIGRMLSFLTIIFPRLSSSSLPVGHSAGLYPTAQVRGHASLAAALQEIGWRDRSEPTILWSEALAHVVCPNTPLGKSLPSPNTAPKPNGPASLAWRA